MKQILNYLLVSATVCAISFTTVGQNTFPSTGPAGINTTTPMVGKALDVNGNMIVDSSLTVKDSVIVEKDMRTKGKFTVEDEAFFLQAVYMNDKLVVGEKIEAGDKITAVGNIESENNVKVGNKLDVSGNSDLSGSVKMPGLSGLANLSNPNLEFVIRTPSGDLKTYGVLDLIDLILAEQEPLEIETCLPGYADDPYWISKVNKLYTVCDEVKVGIGVVNPKHKLHVDGTAYARRFLAGNVDAPTSALINGFSPTSNTMLVQLGQKIGSTGHEVRFQIMNDGTVYAKEIRIREVSSFPDYVFSENYKLMPLKELKHYIAVHKHLPKIPTESEVKKSGMGLGKMQILMMEKIEELTLYSIGLKEENETLHTKLDAQQQEIDALKKEMEEIKSMLNK